MTIPEDYLLPIVTIILILLFILWAVWYYVQNKVTPVSTIGTCPIGQCATNIYGGEKTCPVSPGDFVNYNISSQVCNPANACTNSKTPFPLGSNYGTVTTSNCPQNNCNCLSSVQCPEYITGFFQANDGSPFESLTNSRMTLQQYTSFVNQAGEVRGIPPYTITQIGTQFCSIPIQWIDRIFPKQCISGTLAFITPTISQFNLQTAAKFPLSCVAMEACSTGQTAVWDSTTNVGQCLNLCPTGQEPVWNPQTQTLVCQPIVN